jgi:hypothetical protein
VIEDELEQGHAMRRVVTVETAAMRHQNDGLLAMLHRERSHVQAVMQRCKDLESELQENAMTYEVWTWFPTTWLPTHVVGNQHMCVTLSKRQARRGTCAMHGPAADKCCWYNSCLHNQEPRGGSRYQMAMISQSIICVLK